MVRLPLSAVPWLAIAEIGKMVDALVAIFVVQPALVLVGVVLIARIITWIPNARLRRGRLAFMAGAGGVAMALCGMADTQWLALWITSGLVYALALGVLVRTLERRSGGMLIATVLAVFFVGATTLVHPPFSTWPIDPEELPRASPLLATIWLLALFALNWARPRAATDTNP